MIGDVFVPGDIVEALVDNIEANHTLMAGDTGTYLGKMHPYHSEDFIAVSWDRKIRGGHTCGGRCEEGHGWNVRINNVQLAIRNPDVEIPAEDVFALIGGNL